MEFLTSSGKCLQGIHNGLVSMNFVPDALAPLYGRQNPIGAMAFILLKVDLEDHPPATKLERKQYQAAVANERLARRVTRWSLD